MLKKPFSKDSDVVPTEGIWSNTDASASDEYLKKAACEVNKGVEVSRTQRDVDRFEDRILKPMESGYYTFAKQSSTADKATIESTVKEMAIATSAAMDAKAVERGVLDFVENTKVLMKGLDEVAKLHPFVAVAVLAFKAVVTLELKRRDNDKKVVALKMEMADMMSVLLDLRYVDKSDPPAPDGTTVASRTRRLMEKIAGEIADCGNVCDMYAKKGLVVKVLKAPIFECHLAEFAGLFSDRRNQIAFALQIRTALTVDAANHKLTDMHEDIRTVGEKLNMLLLFRRLDSPHEKELLRLIEDRGGPAQCLGNDTILRELTAVNQATDAAAALSSLRNPLTPSMQSSQNFDPKAFYAMRSELREDVQHALQRNMEVFSRKFQFQKDQLLSEIEGVVERTGDRIIEAVVSGPHDRILDHDLHVLWQDMGWRTSVKARHFVLALHDYFLEKFRDMDPLTGENDSTRSTSPTPSTRSSESGTGTDSLSDAFHDPLSTHRSRRKDSDRWYVGYLSMLRLQPLIECFDDDGTAHHVETKELELSSLACILGCRKVVQASSTDPCALTTRSTGWHASIWAYQNKICGILLVIAEDLKHVLHSNRVVVDAYLSDPVFSKLDLLIRSVVPPVNHDAELERRMSAYVQREEQRMEQNLLAVAFDIDDQNTLSLITGPGRIERYLFPLIFLLLRSHSRVVKVAWDVVLHKDEFNKAIQSLTQVFNAVQERINTLSAIFRQQNLEVNSQLAHFAFGMFHFLGDPDKHLDKSEGNPLFICWEDETLSEDVHPNILRCGIFEEFNIGGRYHELPPFSAKQTTSEFPPIEGAWSGHFFLDVLKTRTDSLVDIVITSCTADGKFKGRGFEAINGKFTVDGEIRPGDGSTFEVQFTRHYPSELGRASIICTGKVDSMANSIKGEWGFPRENLGKPALLTRTATPLYRFRYTEAAFVANRARARWSFACSSVLHQVRQRNCSWGFIQESIARRRRFVFLHIRRDLGWSLYAPIDDLKEGEADELLALELVTCPYDNRLFRLIAKAQLRMTPIHHNTFCAKCRYVPREFRIICLICTNKSFLKQIDLCTGPDCMDKPIKLDDFDHLPVHPVVRAPRLVHAQHVGPLNKSSWKTFHRARRLLRSADEIESDTITGDESDDTETTTDIGGDERSVVSCVCCAKPVSVPFWICVSCYNDDGDDIIICTACDLRRPYQLYDLHKNHKDYHPLVRYQHLEPTTGAKFMSLEAKVVSLEATINERLDGLMKMTETQDAINEDRFDRSEIGMTKRLTELEVYMNTRFDAIETLLRALANKIDGQCQENLKKILSLQLDGTGFLHGGPAVHQYQFLM